MYYIVYCVDDESFTSETILKPISSLLGLTLVSISIFIYLFLRINGIFYFLCAFLVDWNKVFKAQCDFTNSPFSAAKNPWSDPFTFPRRDHRPLCFLLMPKYRLEALSGRPDLLNWKGWARRNFANVGLVAGRPTTLNPPPRPKYRDRRLDFGNKTP